MKKWVFGIAIIISFVLLLSFCGRHENKFTLQEKKSDEKYRYLAYKEKIAKEAAEDIKRILRESDWKRSYISFKENPSDYIFYFNYDRKDENVLVYHLWMTVNPAKVIVYYDKKQMTLEGEEAKQLMENVLSVGFLQ